jgi:cytochrome c oxidase cbb3-type subunit III
MRNLNKYISRALSTMVFTIAGLTAFAQDAATKTTAETAGSSSGFVFDVNSALALVVIFLFLVIAVLAVTLRSSMELYKRKVDAERKQHNSAGKVVAIIAGILLLGSATAIAQTATAAAPEAVSDNKLLRYLLFFIILLGLIAVFALIRWIKFFTGIEGLNGEKAGSTTAFGSWWSGFNKFKPIENEASIDMGHSYDGIRELNNQLPPWYTWTFIFTILFAIGYLWRYHVAHSAPDQYQEYDNAMTSAKLKQDAYLKAQGNLVDENTVKMLDATGIAEGKKVFTTNCVVCHGDKGQGGVGPNLTDDYWIHGGKVNDVFKTIKMGWPEKGMQSWKDVFSGVQIAQLASYVKSLHGTNPSGAKAPQGDLFKDSTTTVSTSPVVAKDSVKVK